MTERRPPYDAASGGLRIGAVPGFVVFIVDVPDQGDAYELLFPVERAEDLVEELQRAAVSARRRRLEAVD